MQLYRLVFFVQILFLRTSKLNITLKLKIGKIDRNLAEQIWIGFDLIGFPKIGRHLSLTVKPSTWVIFQDESSSSSLVIDIL